MSFIADDFDNQEEDADRDGRIRNVKRRPVIVAEVKLEEVNNVSEPEAVIEIAKRTAEDEAEGYLKQTIANGAAETVYDDHNRSDNRKK